MTILPQRFVVVGLTLTSSWGNGHATTYRALIRARNAAYGAGVAPTDVPPVPAISVGNITVGGTGKTPVVRWLVRLLRRRGWTPGILHGGYAQDEPELVQRQHGEAGAGNPDRRADDRIDRKSVV